MFVVQSQIPVQQALRYDSRQNARRGEPPESVFHGGGGWVRRGVSYQLLPAAGECEAFWMEYTYISSIKMGTSCSYWQLECHDKPIRIREMSCSVIGVHPCVPTLLHRCAKSYISGFFGWCWRVTWCLFDRVIWDLFFRPCKVPMELRGVWRWRRTAWRWMREHLI